MFSNAWSAIWLCITVADQNTNLFRTQQSQHHVLFSGLIDSHTSSSDFSSSLLSPSTTPPCYPNYQHSHQSLAHSHQSPQHLYAPQPLTHCQIVFAPWIHLCLDSLLSTALPLTSPVLSRPGIWPAPRLWPHLVSALWTWPAFSTKDCVQEYLESLCYIWSARSNPEIVIYQFTLNSIKEVPLYPSFSLLLSLVHTYTRSSGPCVFVIVLIAELFGFYPLKWKICLVSLLLTHLASFLILSQYWQGFVSHLTLSWLCTYCIYTHTHSHIHMHASWPRAASCISSVYTV